MVKQYWVYQVRCADGTFYTGITTDAVRRIKEHNASARGARYTKTRRPVELVYSEMALSRGEAQKREYILRHLSHAEKEKLATC